MAWIRAMVRELTAGLRVLVPGPRSLQAPGAGLRIPCAGAASGSVFWYASRRRPFVSRNKTRTSRNGTRVKQDLPTRRDAMNGLLRGVALRGFLHHGEDVSV